MRHNGGRFDGRCPKLVMSGLGQGIPIEGQQRANMILEQKMHGRIEITKSSVRSLLVGS
jgi:hypothetical protein